MTELKMRLPSIWLVLVGFLTVFLIPASIYRNEEALDILSGSLQGWSSTTANEQEKDTSIFEDSVASAYERLKQNSGSTRIDTSRDGQLELILKELQELKREVIELKKVVYLSQNKSVTEPKQLPLASFRAAPPDTLSVGKLPLASFKAASPDTLNVGLTRLAHRGVPFIDNWRPIKFNFTNEQIATVFKGFGADDLDTANCTAASIPKGPIAVRFSAHGLGSNLIQLANFITYASHHQYALTMIPMYEFDKGSPIRHGFQNWYEQNFALFGSNDSVCDIFASKCEMQEGRCYDGYWTIPSKDPKMNLWKLATSHVSSYRQKQPDLHDASKAILIREVLRMMPSTRKQFDERYRTTMSKIMSKSDAFKVAMHIRRTDKVGGEAVKVTCDVFMRALVKATEGVPLSKPIVLVIMSDDESVHSECDSAFASTDFSSRAIEMHFRFAKERPDRTGSMRRVEEAFWQLLIDFRVMIEADAFIGSQSSNLGVVVCYLRVHEKCLNVEKSDFDWNPRQSKIA